jgi:hypothetical protein
MREKLNKHKKKQLKFEIIVSFFLSYLKYESLLENVEQSAESEINCREYNFSVYFLALDFLKVQLRQNVNPVAHL